MEQVLLPRLEFASASRIGEVPYDIPEQPSPPKGLETFFEGVYGDKTPGEQWVEWLRANEVARAAYAAGFFVAAGAPTGLKARSIDALLPLGTWLRRWLRPAFEMAIGSDWEDRLSQEARAGRKLPHAAALAQQLFQSFVHDIAFLVVSTARELRPELHWQLQAEASNPLRDCYLATLWNDPPWVDVFHHVYVFVLNTATGGHPKQWPPDSWLPELCRALAGEEPSESMLPLRYAPVPGAREALLSLLSPTRLRRPRRSDPPADEMIVKAAASFRAAGYFARFSDLSDEDLARALAATWRQREYEELAEDPDELDLQLVALDNERTVCEDIEADVGEGGDAYVRYLRELGKRSRGAFKIANVKEDWSSQPGSVVVSFRLDGEKRRVVLVECDDWIDPEVVTGLNELLPTNGPRFFFVDNGGQQSIVTCATEAERGALEATRGIRLLSEAPEWWFSVRNTR